MVYKVKSSILLQKLAVHQYVCVKL